MLALAVLQNLGGSPGPTGTACRHVLHLLRPITAVTRLLQPLNHFNLLPHIGLSIAGYYSLDRSICLPENYPRD